MTGGDSGVLRVDGQNYRRAYELVEKEKAAHESSSAVVTTVDRQPSFEVKSHGHMENHGGSKSALSGAHLFCQPGERTHARLNKWQEIACGPWCTTASSNHG